VTPIYCKIYHITVGIHYSRITENTDIMDEV
jgi:hypothetical protein